MIWQDIVAAIVQAGFMAALVPAVTARAGRAVPLTTSLGTAAGLATIAVCMATLGLWWSATTAGVCAALWVVIALQRRMGRP